MIYLIVSFNVTYANAEKTCPPGEEHHDCYKLSCERSCHHLQEKSCPPREDECSSGCFCKKGLVRKGSECVVPEKCKDCVCEGYGDPHYISFDRTNFTFNGECTYVAARDKDLRGKHTFQVTTLDS